MKHPFKLVLAVAGLSFVSVAVSAQTLATGDSRTVMQPTVPGTCQTLAAQFTQSQRATPPTTDDTTRVQAALTACKGTGNAVVLTSNGTNNAFFTGLITVSGEALVINSGVVLYGSNSYSSAAELVLVTGTNAGIYGPGSIDGRGDLTAISGTPRLVQATNTTNLTIYNVTLTQAKHPNLYLEGGSGATIWGITIDTPANRTNADGIDIDSITNVTVNNSTVTAGDDGIAVKTNSGAASNITVKNSSFYGTHGLSIGSQTYLGVTNILFDSNYIYGVDHYGNVATDDNGVRAKTGASCGGTTKQVYYRNTCMTQIKHFMAVNANYGTCSGTPGTPQFQDIVINGLLATNSVAGGYSEMNGYNAANLATVYVANVQLDINTDQNDQYATVYLDNTNGWTPAGTGITTPAFVLAGAVPTCNFAGVNTSTATITGSSTSVAQGTSATLSATVSYTGKTGPTGAVTFTANGTTVTGTCVSAPAANTCTASFDTTGLSGTYPVTINEAADSAYAAATGTGTLIVTGGTTKTNPTISFAVPNHTYGDAPFAVAATSNSTGAFTYSVQSGPATIAGNTVTLTGAGTVVLLASEASDTNYAAGTKTATVTVAPGTPTISFAVANHTSTDGSFTVAATSNSTGAFTYSVVSGPATIAGNTVTLTGSGTVVLQANEAADANYAAGSAQATFTVTAGTKPAPTISFAVASHTYGDTPFAVTATSNSTGAFTYTVQSGPATISGNTVTLTGAGTVVLLASEAADTNYAAGTKTVTVTVAPGTPTISFSVGNHTTADAPFAVTATSNSTGAFSYSVVSGPATVAGNTVTLTGAGTVVLKATEAADANYNGGSAQATFTVTAGTKPTPTITFAAGNHTYGDAPFAVTATSNSTGAFSYSVQSGPATVAGNTVTLTGAGTVVLLASEAADTNYAAGTATATVIVAKGTPTITFAVANHASTDAPFTVTASSNSTGAFSYSVVSGPATIAGNTVTLTGAGTVVLQASEAADTNYAAANQQATFTVSAATKPAPTITFNVPGATFGAAPFAVTATSNSTGAFTYSVVSGPATISGNVVTLTGPGTVVLQAAEAADATYAAGTATATLTVAKGVVTVTIIPTSTTVNTGASDMLTVTVTSPSGTPSGTVTLLDNGTPLTTVTLVNGTATYTATFATAASQTITATYSGDANYAGITAPTAATTITVTNGTTSSTDFTFASTSVTQVTVSRGQTAVFSFAATPGAGGYPGAVTFTVTGLPAGATATFSPSTIAANGGAQPVVLSVLTAAGTAQNHSVPFGPERGTAYLAMLLPLLAGYRFRRKIGSRLGVVLLLVVTFAGAAALTGCSGGFAASHEAYLNVTATSGSLSHTQAVTVLIQ